LPAFRALLFAVLLALFDVVPGMPAGTGESDYKAEAETRVAAGDLAGAADILETAAIRIPDRAFSLYRQAAWLRERRGEIGQALLDYRAMLKSAPDPSAVRELKPHIAYLSFLLDRNQQLAGLPLAKDLDLQQLFPAWKQHEPAPSREGESEGISMDIPGGLDLFARTAGLDPSALKGSDAAERVFSHILAAAPDGFDDLDSNPVRVAVLAYLRSYASFSQFLEKEKLLPLDYDVAKERTLVFPLIGSEADVARVRKVLSFFAVNYKLKRAKDGQVTASLELKGGEKALQRQRFLRNMGVNLLDNRLRQITVPFQTGSIPLLPGTEAWDRILPSKNGSPLLERMVATPAAMRLYVGLSRCSEATRAGLTRALPPAALLKHADVILILGSVMDFRSGSLWVPGSPQGWEGLLKAPPGDPARFIPALFEHKGRGLMLYSSLASAPPSVSTYFTASPDRLLPLYETLAPYDFGRSINVAPLLAKQNLGRMLRQMNTDQNGLTLEIDGRLAGGLFQNREHDPSGPIHLNPKDIADLLEPAGISRPDQIFSPMSTVELLRYIRRVRPEMLNGGGGMALMADPEQTPLFLDLIWEINPDGGLLAKYINYCSTMAADGSKDWNRNRTRASQSLFFLLSALCHEGALTQEQGRKLLNDSLAVLQSPTESQFADSLAGFLSSELIPQITNGNSGHDDPILRSLAGGAQTRSFGFEGKQMQADLSSYRLHQMEQTIDRQIYTPLPAILEIFTALERAGSTPDSVESRKALIDKLSGLRSVKLPPGSSAMARDLIAHIPAEILQKDVEDLSSVRVPFPELRARIAAQLDTEMGATLLTYCYAYAGSPLVDALVFDPNFVRKHMFYPVLPGVNPRASLTGVRNEKDSGVFLTGTLSGLGYQLCSLATSQTVQSFGTGEARALVPTMFYAMKAASPRLRTDRAQEYVALCVWLGREILALSAVDDGLHEWVDQFISPLLSPRRRTQVDDSVARYDARNAARALTPSELFFLGKAHFDSRRKNVDGRGGDGDAGPYGQSCPILERLKEIVPETGSPDALLFRQEVEQYGVLLRRRIGLTDFSFSLADSYEQLERAASDEILAERVCDLKIRIAELNYTLGIPAFLAEFEARPALNAILPQSSNPSVGGWKLVVEQIQALNAEDVQSWIRELTEGGSLSWK